MSPFIFRVPPVDNNILLVHSNTVNNSTVFVDSSPTALTLSSLNGAIHSTTQSKFGASSMYFNVTGNYVKGTHPNLVLGTGDFTVDTWVYRSGNFAVGGIVSGAGNNNGKAGAVMLTSTATEVRFFAGTNTVADEIPGLFPIALNTWTHLALVRSAGTMTAYKDGQVLGSVASSIDLNSDTIALGLVYHNTTSYSLKSAYLDEVRISNVAEWTSPFTPPTTPY